MARAFLLDFMGYAIIVAEGDPVTADILFARLSEIETSGSISLRVYHAAVSAFVLYYRGDLSSAGILIQDVLPLCGDTDCSLVSRLYLQAANSLYHILIGDLLSMIGNGAVAVSSCYSNCSFSTEDTKCRQLI